MTAQTPTITEMLRRAIDERLLDTHISLPGRVESYDASKLSVDVKPLIKRAFQNEGGDREVEELPVVPSVPVMFPGSGAYRMTFPIKKGDLVLLVFSEASIDSWLDSGSLVDPIDDRRNELIDAIAIPGLRSFKSVKAANEDALVIDAANKLVVNVDAAVLNSPDIKLGSAAASESVIKGNLRDTSEQIFLTALDVFAAATLAPGPAKAAFAAALAVFKTAITGALSAKVKAE